MPQYNSTRDAVIGGHNIRVGTHVYKVYFNVNVHTFLTLVSDEIITPMDTLYTGVTRQAVLNLAEYGQLYLRNFSGEDVTVYINSNDTPPLPIVDAGSIYMLDGESRVLDNPRRIDKLFLHTAAPSDGNFYVEGALAAMHTFLVDVETPAVDF